MMKIIYRIETRYRETINWIRNSWRYRKTLKNAYDYDYEPIMSFTQQHLERLLKSLQCKDNMQEVDETRIPKEKSIKRCLEILKNRKEDNYGERCGYDDEYDITFIGNKMITTETKEQKKQNIKAIKNGIKLELQEQKELIKLMSDKDKGILTWWT